MNRLTVEVYEPESGIVKYSQTVEGNQNYFDEVKAIFNSLEYSGCLNLHDYTATPLKVRFKEN